MKKRLDTKEVQLKDIDGNNFGSITSYAQLYITALNSPANGQGFNVIDMQARMDLINKIKEAMHQDEDGLWHIKKDHIDITKTEHALLQDCVNSRNWTLVSQEILDFVNHVKNTPNAPKPEEPIGEGE